MPIILCFGVLRPSLLISFLKGSGIFFVICFKFNKDFIQNECFVRFWLLFTISNFPSVHLPLSINLFTEFRRRKSCQGKYLIPFLRRKKFCFFFLSFLDIFSRTIDFTGTYPCFGFGVTLLMARYSHLSGSFWLFPQIFGRLACAPIM